jgi:predicted RNA binding protein YcfA (HicA-like mRNA interferase family)
MRHRLFSSDQVINALERAGFELKRTRGSHAALIRQKSDASHAVVIVPLGKSAIPRGTFRSILAQAELEYEEFLTLAEINEKGFKKRLPKWLLGALVWG